MRLLAYLHVYPVGHWQEIVLEILDLMSKARLLSELEFSPCIVQFGDSQEATDLLAEYQPLEVEHDGTEWPTLARVHSSAVALTNVKEEARILYFHTKGVTSRHRECADDHRRFMLYFLLERWQEALRALEEDGISAVGCNLRNKPLRPNKAQSYLDSGKTVPHELWHFSGNFWWARADALSTLPKPGSPEADAIITWRGAGRRHRRLSAERWVGTLGRPSLRSLHESNVDHEKKRHLRWRYAEDANPI